MFDHPAAPCAPLFIPAIGWVDVAVACLRYRPIYDGPACERCDLCLLLATAGCPKLWEKPTEDHFDYLPLCSVSATDFYPVYSAGDAMPLTYGPPPCESLTVDAPYYTGPDYTIRLLGNGYCQYDEPDLYDIAPVKILTSVITHETRAQRHRYYAPDYSQREHAIYNTFEHYDLFCFTDLFADEPPAYLEALVRVLSGAVEARREKTPLPNFIDEYKLDFYAEEYAAMRALQPWAFDTAGRKCSASTSGAALREASPLQVAEALGFARSHRYICSGQMLTVFGDSDSACRRIFVSGSIGTTYRACDTDGECEPAPIPLYVRCGFRYYGKLLNCDIHGGTRDDPQWILDNTEEADCDVCAAPMRIYDPYGVVGLLLCARCNGGEAVAGPTVSPPWDSNAYPLAYQ